MPPSFFPDPLPPFNIDTSLGAFEIGTIVAAFLFGITTLQVYLYFEQYPNDGKILKLMVRLLSFEHFFAANIHNLNMLWWWRQVMSIWLLELGHTITISHSLYVMTITWYGQPQLLVVPPITLDISILFNALVGLIEQAWFTRRLYAFSKNLWLTGLCALLSLTRLGSTLAYGSLATRRMNIFEFQLKYWWILTIIVVVGSVNDFILASSLAWHLYARKKGAFRSIVKLLERLIAFTIETSAITTIATLTMMICFFMMPMNFIYIGVYLCLAKSNLDFQNSHSIQLNSSASFQFTRMPCSHHSMPEKTSLALEADLRHRVQSPVTELAPGLLHNPRRVIYFSPGIVRFSDDVQARASTISPFDREFPDSPDGIVMTRYPILVKVDHERHLAEN
ncbi:hypothetical protein D9757_006797 [Collybiopsis confluens]|uniref:DUF6534 domain-containing protein n=1 Tax=Collybiopsis confluens TaxID=2823264 RepID=A0A8H5HLG7_9AGAR|nr:hypothetical protein D9757_006797 [Collybiopsis confluens]